MKIFGIIFIIISLIIFKFPDILAYIVAIFFMFIWLNLVFIWFKIWSNKNSKEDYVQFWNYKIYKN